MRIRNCWLLGVIALAGPAASAAHAQAPRPDRVGSTPFRVKPVVGNAIGGFVLGFAAGRAEGHTQIDGGTMFLGSILGGAALGVIGQLVPWTSASGRAMHMYVMPGMGFYDLRNVGTAIDARTSSYGQRASDFALAFDGPITRHWRIGLEAGVISHKYEETFTGERCFDGLGCVVDTWIVRDAALNSIRAMVTTSYVADGRGVRPLIGAAYGLAQGGLSAEDADDMGSTMSGWAPVARIWAGFLMGSQMATPQIRIGYQRHRMALSPVRHNYAGGLRIDAIDFSGAFVQVGAGFDFGRVMPRR